MKRSVDLVVVVALLAVFLALNALLFGRAARVARRTELVPVPSTWRTTPAGTRALYELLARSGTPVGRWAAPLTRPLPEEVTVFVLLEPQIYVSQLELQQLRSWVDRGHTLIVASRAHPSPTAPARELPAHLFLREPTAPAEPVERPDEPFDWRVERPNHYLAGVRELALRAPGPTAPTRGELAAAADRLIDRRRAWPVAGGDVPLSTVTRLGAGRLIHVAAPELFSNARLAEADNAIFVTNLILAHRGAGRVLFDEFHLGNLGAESIWALLARPPWRWLVLQLLLAGLLAAARAAIRFGPVRPPGPPPRRAASEYVLALAALHRRGGTIAAAAATWREELLVELARLAGVGGEPDRERLLARLSRPADAAAVRRALARLDRLASGGGSEAELVAACQEAEAALRPIRRRTWGDD